MARICTLLLLFCLLRSVAGTAQSGFYLYSGKRQVDIPFEYINNFIILTIQFNGSLPLKFILDTGAEHTILNKREITDLLRLKYEREFHVTGADLNAQLTAYLVRNVRLDLLDMAVAPRQDILVLQEDYFRFEEYNGVIIHGILSANVFSKFLIKINYQNRLLTLYDRATFRLHDSGFQEVPVEVLRNKIYLNTTLQVRPDSTAPVKLLLDTGAGLPLLLFADTHPYLHAPVNAIPSNIGMGLGGFLEGFIGRVYSFGFGTFSEKNVVTYFQTLDSLQSKNSVNHRNGLIGNAILDRFELILDYQNSRIWIKPTRNYDEAFVYDRSGLNAIATGLQLNTFTIQTVLPNSPAAEADLRPGDIILRLGWRSANLLSLTELQRVLQKRVGKKIIMVIERDNKRLKKTFFLRDLI